MRKEDQDWVSERIRVATQLPEVRGIKKVLRWLREYSLLVGLITITVTIMVSISIFIFSSITRESEFRGSTDQHFKNIDTHSSTVDQRLTGIETSLVAIRIQLAAANPRNTKNQSEAADLLKSAKKDGITIPDNVIREAGTSFLEASRVEPKAWEAALDFVSYHTIINKDLLAVGTADQIATTPIDPNLTTHYKILGLSGYAFPKASVGGDVSEERAATIHLLGEQSLDQGQPRGKQVILLEGGGVKLDGMVLRNVVIRNTVVSYSGGPISLDNVIFVNCVFLLPNEAQPRNFATMVLNQQAITFPGA